MAGYTEEQYEQSQDPTPTSPQKGSAEWAEQNSGVNAPRLTSAPDPAPGTPEAYEKQQGETPATSAGVSTAPASAGAKTPTASTDTEHEIPALSPEQQLRVDATAGTDRQIKTVKDWMDAEENRPETPEQRKKRERQEKSRRIIAAVIDGVSALSNLYFTTQYAPNMYNPEKGSVTTAVGKRLEQQKAERERKRDRYMNFALKLGDLENQRAATLRELEAQQERQRLARENAQREQEAHNWMAALQPDKQREQAGKAGKAEQEAIAAEYEAKNKPKELELKNATETAKAGAYRAATVNSLASANAHNRSNVPGFSAWDEHGKEHKFHTKDEAEAYARQHNTWKEEDVTETTETSSTTGSRTTTGKSTKTKKGGYAGRTSPTGKKSPTA